MIKNSLNDPQPKFHEEVVKHIRKENIPMENEQIDVSIRLFKILAHNTGFKINEFLATRKIIIVHNLVTF